MARSSGPTVSVGLLTYNRADYLREAVRGVLSQTFEDFELLICDNHSNDDTPDVVAGFSDPRIRYLRHEENIGPHRNYLSAVDCSRGEYLLVTADDDIIEPDLLARQIEVMRRWPDVGLVATDVSLIDETGRTIQPRLLQLDSDLLFRKYEYVQRYLQDQLWIPTPSWMYRVSAQSKSAWREAKTAGPLGDVYLLCGLNLDEELMLLADPLVRYRQHPGQYQRQINTTEAGVQFYKALRGLCQAEDALFPILPRVEARLVSYEAELLVTTAPNCRRAVEVRSAGVARLDRRWRRAVRFADRDVDEILRFELLKLLHGMPPSFPLDRCRDGNGLNGLYRRWLSLTWREGGNLTDGLARSGVRSVAVLGSYLTAYLLALDAMRSGIEVRCFLDSSAVRQGELIAGRPVEAPAWLASPGADVDAVLLSSEKHGEQAIVAMLREHVDKSVPILSWKRLAAHPVQDGESNGIAESRPPARPA